MMGGRSLAIFLPSLASGGAERVHINLAPEFMRRGWKVTFVLQKKEGALLQQVPRGVELVSLDAKSTFGALIPLARYLREAKPDILLSNLGHNNIVAIWAKAMARGETRIIATQHNTLSAECKSQKNWRYRILPLLSRIFLRSADDIVAVSSGVAVDLAKTADLKRSRITAIYNPVIFADFEKKMNAHIMHKWLDETSVPVIVAAGRLVPQKDFRTLILAFEEVLKQTACRLIILGEGPLQTELAELAASLKLGDSIEFTGFQPNILPYMRKASLLVMSSRFEGFGNVLVEALACGTKVVSTDCPHGPAEILENGKFGALVPVGNAGALAEAIIDALGTDADKTALKERGKVFSVSRAAEAYQALFERK